MQLSFQQRCISTVSDRTDDEPLGKTQILTTESKRDMEVLDSECEEVLGLF